MCVTRYSSQMCSYSNINIPSLNAIKCVIYVEYHGYIKDLGLEFLFAVLLMDGMGPRMLGKYCTTEHFKRERKKLAVFNKSRSVSLSVSLHLSICHSLHIHIYYIWYIITNYIYYCFLRIFSMDFDHIHSSPPLSDSPLL